MGGVRGGSTSRSLLGDPPGFSGRVVSNNKTVAKRFDSVFWMLLALAVAALLFFGNPRYLIPALTGAPGLKLLAEIALFVGLGLAVTAMVAPNLIRRASGGDHAGAPGAKAVAAGPRKSRGGKSQRSR